MKSIYSTPDQKRAASIKGYLGTHGIVSFLTISKIASLISLPGPDLFANVIYSIDVPQETDEAEALRLLRGWLHAEGSKPNWQCLSCEELIESQFDSCWKCGAERHLSESRME